jgi:ATP-dependent DNA helicase RecG
MQNKELEFYKFVGKDIFKMVTALSNSGGGKLVLSSANINTPINASNIQLFKENIMQLFSTTFLNVYTLNIVDDTLEVIIPACKDALSFENIYYYQKNGVCTIAPADQIDTLLTSKLPSVPSKKIIEGLKLEEFDEDGFECFKQICHKSNITTYDKMTPLQILEELNLSPKNGICIETMLTFYQNPERFLQGSYLLITEYSQKGDRLRFEEVHGSIMRQALLGCDIVYENFFKNTPDNTYPYPKEAIYEAILNALGYKDYTQDKPSQVRIYSTKLYVSNQWTNHYSLKEDILRKPDDDFKDVTHWSIRALNKIKPTPHVRGIKVIDEAMKANNLQIPSYTLSDKSFSALFRTSSRYLTSTR